MSEEERVYGVMLWGQVEVVQGQCTSGKKRMKSVIHYLKTIKGEEDHQLSALSKILSQLAMDGPSSLSTAVAQIRSHVEEEVRTRTTFAKAIQELIEKLSAFRKTHEKAAHSLHARWTQETAHYESRVSHLNKAKAHYYHCCRNEDHLRSCLSLPDLEPKQQTGLQLQLDKAVESKHVAREQYTSLLIEHERTHHDHNDVARDLLNEYQRLEIDLTTLLKEILVHAVSQREAFVTSMMELTTSMKSSALLIDPKGDSQKFMSDHSHSLTPDPPPVFEEYNADSGLAAKKGNPAMKVLTNIKISTMNATRSAGNITRKMSVRKKRKDGVDGEDDPLSPRDRPLSPSIEMCPNTRESLRDSKDGDGDCGRE
jgi:hypothetical protein